MTREEAYNLICALNEEAHMLTYDEWEAAEDDEELLEQASIHQAEQFNEIFSILVKEQQEGIRYWIDNDDSFREEFNQWSNNTNNN